MIPEHTKEDIDAYVKQGRPVGEFLTAVICNQLKESFERADDRNLRSMFDIVKYMYNDVPSIAWGSKERMDAWVNHGGLEGLE